MFFHLRFYRYSCSQEKVVWKPCSIGMWWRLCVFCMYFAQYIAKIWNQTNANGGRSRKRPSKELKKVVITRAGCLQEWALLSNQNHKYLSAQVSGICKFIVVVVKITVGTSLLSFTSIETCWQDILSQNIPEHSKPSLKSEATLGSLSRDQYLNNIIIWGQFLNNRPKPPR